MVLSLYENFSHTFLPFNATFLMQIMNEKKKQIFKNSIKGRYILKRLNIL